MQIVSPSYSFVKFDSPEVVNGCCDGTQDFCVPVIEETDTYFQVKITSDVYAEIQDLMGAPMDDFQLLLLKGSGNTAETVAGNFLRNWSFTDGQKFERYRTGTFEVTFQWRAAFKYIKDLVACGDCFQIGFVRADSVAMGGEFTDEFTDEFDIGTFVTLIAFTSISNCFKRFCSDCYMSVLEYSNEEDYADFNYCNMTDPVNRVRLPFYLSRPKTIEDNAVYRMSGGVIKQTRSLITKEYLALTDSLPEWVHDKIIIALGHDLKNVYSDSYIGGLSKNGEYAIGWDEEFNLCTAPANFKATATPFAVRNNNCQDCEEVELCIGINVPDFTLHDSEVGEVYSQTVTLNGSLPITLSDVGKPAWMTVTLIGRDLSFTGTPVDTDAGETIPISFTVSNLCTEPVTIVQTINIKDMSPGMIVMWSGDPTAIPSGWALCDGNNGVPDLRAKFIVGYDATDADYNHISATGGEKMHTLGITEMPAHTHGITSSTASAFSGAGSVPAVLADTTEPGGATDSTGGGAPHENRPPYYTLAFIIKL